MKVCFDVQYTDNGGCVSAVLFEKWNSDTPTETHQMTIVPAGDYQPGQFYKRELKPIEQLLRQISNPVEVIIVDAYCTLTADGKPGLGAHLYQSQCKQTPVIGVAKNCFQGTDHAIEVLRGESDRPLFVTAKGMQDRIAANYIQSMHGDYRHPSLVKLADSLAREGALKNIDFGHRIQQQSPA